MAGLLRRASRPKERPGEPASPSAADRASSSPREADRAPANAPTVTPSPRRPARKEEDASFEISELMKQVIDWKHRYQAEKDEHQKTKDRLFQLETELCALKGLPPPTPRIEGERRSSSAGQVMTIPIPSSPPSSAPASPTSSPPTPTASPAPVAAVSSPTASSSPASPNFFRSTGRQMGRFLGGGSSSQRGERRIFGVRLEAVMTSPTDLPRVVSNALGYIADNVNAEDIDSSLKNQPLGDLKHQIERGTTIDFSSLPDGKAKAQHILLRFLVELPEPLVPADIVQQLQSAKAIPPPVWRQRRLFLALALGLSPLQRGVLDAYLSTLAGMVAKAGKPLQSSATINVESEQLERTIAHLEGTLQQILEAASRQSSPDTLTAARDFAKDVQELTDHADKRLSPSSPPSLAALRNEFSRHSKASMSALKGVLTASPGVLPVQLQQLRENCERVKTSAAALRNVLAPPPPPPVAEDNSDAKKRAATRLAIAFTSAFFGPTDDKEAPSLAKQNSAPVLPPTPAPSASSSIYATVRRATSRDRGRHSESGETSSAAVSPPPATTANSLLSFLSPPTAAPLPSKTTVVETLLLEWADITAVEKIAQTSVDEGRTQLTSAAFEVCLDKLLETNPMDPEFRPLLLQTHPYMMSSEEFLTHLLSRYAPSPSTPFEREVNAAVEAVLKVWFASCMPASPEPLLAQLRTFAGSTSGTLRFAAADLHALAKPKALPPSPAEAENGASPFPGVKLRVEVTTVDILNRDPEEIAQQILLIDLDLFHAIPLHEFILGNTSKAGRAPAHTRLVDAYNTWARWIAGEVLAVSDAQRHECLTQAIRIADTCRKIGDFCASFALYCGISFSSISRLESVWAKVPKRWTEKYEELREIFSSKQEFKKLRSEMKKVSPACVVVPYTGLYTKWLVAVEENNRTFNDNLVNLSKLRLIWRLCREIQSYQQRGVAPYLPSPDLKRLLLTMKPLTEDQLWEKSLIIEPSSRPMTSRTRGSLSGGPEASATPQQVGASNSSTNIAASAAAAQQQHNNHHSNSATATPPAVAAATPSPQPPTNPSPHAGGKPLPQAPVSSSMPSLSSPLNAVKSPSASDFVV